MSVRRRVSLNGSLVTESAWGTGFHPSMERRKGERERGRKKEVKTEAKRLGSIYLILLELKAERAAEERDRDRDR